MKRKHPPLTIVAAILLIGGFVIQPAQAGISISIGTGHHYGHHHKHSAYGVHNYKRKHHYQRSYQRKYSSHRYHQNNRHSDGKRGYSKHLGRYDCHAVTKWAYDDYGQKLKIGGTMCYDAYGQAYVVPGSRYLIHQY